MNNLAKLGIILFFVVPTEMAFAGQEGRLPTGPKGQPKGLKAEQPKIVTFAEKYLTDLPDSVQRAWMTGKPLSSEDCIVLGNVKEVKKTPDDDFYFTRVALHVEKVLWGKVGSEEIQIKLVPGFISKARIERTYNKKAVSKEQLDIGGIGTADDDLSGYKQGDRLVIALTKIPWQLHEFKGTLSSIYPYPNLNYQSRVFQYCDGYYEPGGLCCRFVVIGANAYRSCDPGVKMSLDKLIRDIKLGKQPYLREGRR
jgi:hypothetical protein